MARGNYVLCGGETVKTEGENRGPGKKEQELAKRKMFKIATKLRQILCLFYRLFEMLEKIGKNLSEKHQVYISERLMTAEKLLCLYATYIGTKITQLRVDGRGK